MKLNEIKDLSVSDGEAKIVELKAELAKERALIASGTRSEKPAKIKQLKKTIARIFTIMNEKKGKEIKEKKRSKEIK